MRGRCWCISSDIGWTFRCDIYAATSSAIRTVPVLYEQRLLPSFIRRVSTGRYKGRKMLMPSLLVYEYTRSCIARGGNRMLCPTGMPPSAVDKAVRAACAFIAIRDSSGQHRVVCPGLQFLGLALPASSEPIALVLGTVSFRFHLYLFQSSEKGRFHSSCSPPIFSIFALFYIAASLRLALVNLLQKA